MLCIPCADIPHFDGFVSGRGNKMISTWHKRNTGHIVIMTCRIYMYMLGITDPLILFTVMYSVIAIHTLFYKIHYTYHTEF